MIGVWLPYAVVITLVGVFLVLPTAIRMRREEREARAMLAEAHATGRHEPASIRPHVDPRRCMGSGACVKACPEGDVLRVINGTAHVVVGSHCVGHGACVAACPTDAISLVFGSERRGVELPDVGPDFQTNVAGLYIAGELGGMGLIANAVRQGVEAIDYLPSAPRPGSADYDVIIVGAGPAGIGAALQAIRRGMTYLLLEQDAFGGAIRHYPRQKLVMTRPIELPGFGRVDRTHLRKEELVALFEQVAAKTGLRVDGNERVDGVARGADGLFTVTTPKRQVRAPRVVLAVGRRGTPRRLDVPGEDLEKVAYRLIDPELYQHQHVLVVGGGDSAVEAAVSLAEQPGNRVWLSYRRPTLARPKQENVDRFDAAVARGAVTPLFESEVVEIGVDRVRLTHRGEDRVLPNDLVLVFAGGVLPTALLTEAGIKVRTHHGHRIVDA